MSSSTGMVLPHLPQCIRPNIIIPLVASIGMLYTLAQGHSLAKLFADALTGWSDTSWALSITTQLSASCLIALRIWTVQNRSLLARSRAASRCMPIIWMILESGAILSFATVILLALYTRHAVAGGVLVGICGQLVVGPFAE